jgi:hypothetical protein
VCPGALLSGYEIAKVLLPTIRLDGGTMRATLALLCLFCGFPNNMTPESSDTLQEPKVEKYRILLGELASSGTVSAVEALIDLPEGLKEAIEVWTEARDRAMGCARYGRHQA